MSENRLPDYLEHMQPTARDACSFVEGMSQAVFLKDKRTQQAAIMSLVTNGSRRWFSTRSYSQISFVLCQHSTQGPAGPLCFLHSAKYKYDGYFSESWAVRLTPLTRR